MADEILILQFKFCLLELKSCKCISNSVAAIQLSKLVYNFDIIYPVRSLPTNVLQYSSVCYDLSSAFACGFWYNITNGCNDTSAFMYNISQIYCRDTCG